MSGADVVTLAVRSTASASWSSRLSPGTARTRCGGRPCTSSAPAGIVFASGETVISEAASGDSRAEVGSASRVEPGQAFLGTRAHVRGVLQVANAPGGPAFSDAVVVRPSQLRYSVTAAALVTLVTWGRALGQGGTFLPVGFRHLLPDTPRSPTPAAPRTPVGGGSRGRGTVRGRGQAV